jgi:hypothetical protein
MESSLTTTIISSGNANVLYCPWREDLQEVLHCPLEDIVITVVLQIYNFIRPTKKWFKHPNHH